MNTTNQSAKIHCPNCKSLNLFETTQSEQNRIVHFMNCRDCETKFLNPKDLEDELNTDERHSRIARIIFIIGAIASIVILALLTGLIIELDMLAQYIYIMILCGSLATMLGTFILIACNKGPIKKKKAELEYLKTNCFDEF